MKKRLTDDSLQGVVGCDFFYVGRRDIYTRRLSVHLKEFGLDEKSIPGGFDSTELVHLSAYFDMIKYAQEMSQEILDLRREKKKMLKDMKEDFLDALDRWKRI